MSGEVFITEDLQSCGRILVQVTIYRGPQIGRDDHLV